MENKNVLQKNFEINLSISDAVEIYLLRVCEKSGMVPHMTSHSTSQQKKEATCIACFISALTFIASLKERRPPPIPTRTDHSDQDHSLKFIVLITIWKCNSLNTLKLHYIRQIYIRLPFNHHN